MVEQTKRRGNAAFEDWTQWLILVLVLGFGWVAMTTNVVSKGPSRARLEKARREVRAIHEAALLYRQHHGVVPTVGDLTTPDETGHVYIDASLIDPWGEEYDLVPAGRSRSQAEAVSAGPDGEFGTEDDLWYPDDAEETR